MTIYGFMVLSSAFKKLGTGDDINILFTIFNNLTAFLDRPVR